MSKLSEYMGLIPKALGNPKQVLEGWVNLARLELGNLPEDQVEEVVRRRLICSQCPFMSENAKKISQYKSSREESHCTLCSCPIAAKTASLSSVCGAQYYNETHLNSSPLEVKWNSYDSKT